MRRRTTTRTRRWRVGQRGTSVVSLRFICHFSPTSSDSKSECTRGFLTRWDQHRRKRRRRRRTLIRILVRKRRRVFQS